MEMGFTKLEEQPIVLGKVHRIGKLPIWKGEYTCGLLQSLYYDNTTACLARTKYVYALSNEKCMDKVCKMALKEQESLEPKSFSFELKGE